MRILYCNKYNYPFSGTESYLFHLMAKMEQRGHEVALFSMDHHQDSAYGRRSFLLPYLNFKDQSAGFFKKAGMAAHAVYSFSARSQLRESLTRYSPDVAHIRGIYHHLSPSVLWELKKRGVPVLYHLNDFKMLCPTYNMVRDGQACESCRGGHYYRMLKNGCYAGPRAAAAILATEAYVHHWLRTYEKCVDLFLAPSEFVRNKLMEAGIPGQQIEVLHHFQELPPEAELKADQGYALYFGRLSAEKGLDELLRTMVRLPHVPLVIAGEGPERARLEQVARDRKLSNVCFRGQLHGKELDDTIAGSSFTIFPSQAYETLGKSILESYAWGRAVIATDLGSRREFVQDGVTGVLYPPRDRERLAEAIELLYGNRDFAGEMGAAGRERIRRRHDPEKHLDAMQEIYLRLAPLRKNRIFVPGSPSQLRVAFIGGRGVISKYSGIESYYESAGRELARRGHRVTLYCRSYFTPRLHSLDGMQIVRLPAFRTKHLETLTHTALSTVHAMLSGYDIIHYHALGPSLFAFLPRLIGIRTVVTVQGLDWQRKKWGRVASTVLQCGEWASARLPNATMVVSKTLQDHYLRHGGQTTYVPNGTELIVKRKFGYLDGWRLQGNGYVLFTGRLSPEKNCDLLIRAFEQLTTDAVLVFAGGSSHSDEYVAALRRHESERIRFLPWVSGDSLQELLSNAALFVLPSDMEGLSLALLDALAAGVCVLVSDIPENREVVQEAGFTFQQGNETDLALRMEFLLRNPALRQETGAKARERAQQNYLWKDVSALIEGVYYSVLGRKPLELPVPAKTFESIQADKRAGRSAGAA